MTTSTRATSTTTATTTTTTTTMTEVATSRRRPFTAVVNSRPASTKRLSYSSSATTTAAPTATAAVTSRRRLQKESDRAADSNIEQRGRTYGLGAGMRNSIDPSRRIGGASAYNCAKTALHGGHDSRTILLIWFIFIFVDCFTALTVTSDR
jgi:hypothetical protein